MLMDNFDLMLSGTNKLACSTLCDPTKSSSVTSSGYWEDFESPTKNTTFESSESGNVICPDVRTLRGLQVRSQKNRTDDDAIKMCGFSFMKDRRESEKQGVCSPPPHPYSPMERTATWTVNAGDVEYFGSQRGNPSFQADTSTDAKAISYSMQSHPDKFRLECNESTSNTRLDRHESPAHQHGDNFCDTIEEWLHQRPAWMYEKPKKTKYDLLQFCFLSDSDQDTNDKNCALSRHKEQPIDMAINSKSPTSPVNIPNGALVLRDVKGTSSTKSLGHPDTFVNQCDPNSQVGIVHHPMLTSFDHTLSQEECQPYEDLIKRLRKTNRYFEYYLHKSIASSNDPKLWLKLTAMLDKFKADMSHLEISIHQIPYMAKMQAEVERVQPKLISRPVQKLLNLDMESEITHFNRRYLYRSSVAQLQLIFNDLHASIEVLNSSLIRELAERDDLYLAQGAKLTEVDDIVAYGKELCQRCNSRQSRHARLTEPMLVADFLHLRPIWMTGRARVLYSNARSSEPPSCTKAHSAQKLRPTALEAVKRHLLQAFKRDKVKHME